VDDVLGANLMGSLTEKDLKKGMERVIMSEEEDTLYMLLNSSTFEGKGLGV
jgi:hypothetical protein